MTLRVGINGFGRIGRAVFRAMLKNNDSSLEIVHINDLASPQTLAHLLKYDTVHGMLDNDISVNDNVLTIDGRSVTISAIRDPGELPWAQKNVDFVFECSGCFRKREQCELHLQAGAKKVLISAPASNEDITVVYGVNHRELRPEHKIVSNGSCTTNCLAPPTKVIDEQFGVISGLVTTVHAYTNDQSLLDVPHSDLRRSRAAAQNMIPTSTGAAKAIGLVLPNLKGKIDGLAIRVPTPNVSVVDATYLLKKPTTTENVQEVLKTACETTLKGVMNYTYEPLVSSDFNGNSSSSFIDMTMTKVSGGTLLKFLSWYDNEMGFSHRMLDVVKLMA